LGVSSFTFITNECNKNHVAGPHTLFDIILYKDINKYLEMNLTNMDLEKCLISKEKIENKITLPCHHSYEYYYLYSEIIEQKNRHSDYFKCPYCRKKYNSTIPFYEIEEIKQINIVNYHKNVLPLIKCTWNKCADYGNKYKCGDYCKKHYVLANKKKCEHICKNGNPCKNSAINGNSCNKHNKHKDNIL